MLSCPGLPPSDPTGECIDERACPHRLDRDRRILPGHPGPGLVGHPAEDGHDDRLLPCRPPPGMAYRGGFHLRLQHRLRASRGPGRLRRNRRCGAGPLRTTRLVPAGAGLGHGTLLHALEGLHHARIPGASLLAAGPDPAVAHFARGLRADQDRRGHLRRRGRLQRADARAALPGHEQLLAGLGPGDRLHRGLHGAGGACGRSPTPRPCRHSSWWAARSWCWSTA